MEWVLKSRDTLCLLFISKTLDKSGMCEYECMGLGWLVMSLATGSWCGEVSQ